MSWSSRYAIKSYIRSSLWIVPFASVLAFLVLIRLADGFDRWLAWSWDWKIEPSAAQAALQTTITLVLSFLVFTFGSMLVAIQVASAQLTPRIIATTLLRDDSIRLIVGLFIFELLFSTGVLIRSQTNVRYLLLTISMVLGVISLAAFLYLIDYCARLLRPVSIMWMVGEQGLGVIRSVYPDPLEDPFTPRLPTPSPGTPARVLDHDGRSAIILAVNVDALIAEAERCNGVIEFAHHVGNFVGVGEPLFLLHGGAAGADDRKLRGAVAFGPERTIEQDATFALRVIVDIGIKALSKAINDPTTGVLAVDQLQRLLRVIGMRHLHDDAIRDSAGNVRLIFPTPNWEDFVHLACREMRLYGAENFQVARRLRAMIEFLLRNLPEHRRPALQEELVLLDQMIDKVYLLPQDAALARIPDLQGLGGSSRD